MTSDEPPSGALTSEEALELGNLKEAVKAAAPGVWWTLVEDQMFETPQQTLASFREAATELNLTL